MADIQLIRGSNGNGPAVRPVVTAARSSGSLTIKVNSTTNLPSRFIGTWGKLNQDTGKLVSSSIRDFYGEVNGADIDLVRMADGFTDDGNEAGDVIVIKPNTDWTHNLADVLEVSHNQDGTLNPNTVEGILSRVYPIGSLYFNATDDTNPATLLGFGTWVAFGAGRVPVGFNSSESEFNAAEKTGGAKTHTLTTAQMPNHRHTNRYLVGTNSNSFTSWVHSPVPNGSTYGFGYGNHVTDTEGGGQAHNNLQPYITVYMWKRTA